MQPIIKVKNLNFIYNKGKDNEFQALVNVNLEIYPEEFIVFFGPSGCGKSTLLNVISGLETPESGTIEVAGKDLMKMDAKEFALYHRSCIGMVFQAYNLITSLSVLDNVALPQMFLNANKKEREKKGLELLERFGILKQAKKIPTELSGGQQQRIGIARSIVNDPEIILADEPVGNLDSVSAKNVLDILKELNEKEKKMIILVTHNPENLEYGDRILYMKDGMIVRESVNKENKARQEKINEKSPSSELEDLMRAYQGLTPEQINIIIMPYKAKVFSNYFLSNRNIEEARIFEEAVQKKLMNIVSHDEFLNTLHRPYQEGGVGFNKSTAEKIGRKINRKIRMAYFIYRKGHQKKDEHGRHIKITDEEKAEKLTYYLLNTCYKDHYRDMEEESLARLKHAVKDRIFHKLSKVDFLRFLDLPVKQSGVGLNSKTARIFTEELELILILGFGMSQKLQGNKQFSSPIEQAVAEKIKAMAAMSEAENGGEKKANGQGDAANSKQ